MSNRFSIPYKTGSAMYQRALAVCHLHGKPYDKLPDVVKQTLDKEAASKDIVRATISSTDDGLKDAIENVEWELQNLTKVLREIKEKMGHGN